MVNWHEATALAEADGAAKLWIHLWTIECAYWQDVDFNNGSDAASFYTVTGVFDIGVPGSRMEGQEEIAAFYGRRQARGTRTTLHSVTNFMLTAWGEDWAETRSIMSLMGADGAPPCTSGVPIMTAASENHYIRSLHGWQVTKRILTPCFTDEGNLPLREINETRSENVG
ncbi:nuclear transport factor 2 family protein [Mycobacterium colombiense]|uniref:nuclear transport factor 2 family protein n=1 Tax=Mycobacterium colombiense TaxID=339268 RepID=UPI00200AFC25|nr:nuclear transport factor 2 family protein [Mycobacterium colombiense]MCK8646708.1 nuclear transport factor 2 family protein [Mycobacterium colombiense]